MIKPRIIPICEESVKIISLILIVVLFSSLGIPLGGAITERMMRIEHTGRTDQVKTHPGWGEFSRAATSQSSGEIKILVDLTHGQSLNGLDIIMDVTPEVRWYVLVESRGDVSTLPQSIREKNILVGGFAAVDLTGIDVVIIGQPTKLFTPGEIASINHWFTSSPKRVLWLAADSDYPAEGGETAQKAVNMVLEALNSHLRVDYVSVENPGHCISKSYEILGVFDNCEIPDIAENVVNVLFHGPGAIALVDDNGVWHKLTPPSSQYEFRVRIIVTTSRSGTILEHLTPPQGSRGKAYRQGDGGVITLMALEFIPTGGGGEGVVIVSGETPYGGYCPLTAPEFAGSKLDGPTFFRNIVTWIAHYKGLKITHEDTATENSSEDVYALNTLIALVGALALFLIILLGIALYKPRKIGNIYMIYLQRLEKMYREGRISERVYRILKKEYEEKSKG